jgi:hypothetical protein
MGKQTRAEAMREAWRKRKKRGGKGLCDYCKEPVFAGGEERDGKLRHAICLVQRQMLKEYEDKKAKGTAGIAIRSSSIVCARIDRATT